MNPPCSTKLDFVHLLEFESKLIGNAPLFSSPERMALLSLPIAFTSAIEVFAPVFARPVWQHVQVLMTGAVLAPGQRTVTAMLRSMGRSAASDFQT